MSNEIFFIIMMAVFVSAGVALYYFYSKDDSKIFQEALEEARLNVLADELSKAMDQSSITTKEATEAVEGLNKALDSPKVSTLYADNVPILTVSRDETIERISPPKEYCQCEYCGTFYNEFVSNCKNCGAQIRIPSELYKPYYIIKTNYKHNVFDI